MIRQMLQDAYAAMDAQTGMFPAEWRCKVCKKTLNANGLHPAELYAGTYTGLCYTCEQKPYYVAKTYALDDAMILSYPPSCPSWRRNRETYYAFGECPACKGTGITSALYANHREQCKDCLNRYFTHPLREWADRRRTQIYSAAENVWHAEVQRVARTMLRRKAKKKEVTAQAAILYKEPRMDAIKRELLARHSRAIQKLSATIELRGIYATK